MSEDLSLDRLADSFATPVAGKHGEEDEHFPRTVTNYCFVNRKNEMVGIAQGVPHEPLYLSGLAGSAYYGYESGQRLAAGLWQHDEISRERSPTEIFWIKAKINEITSGTAPWFRLG